MPQLIAVNPKFHQHTVVNPKLVKQEASELHLVPAVLNEFQKLVVQYPIVFSKKEDTGQFTCSALLGLEEGENLFWEQGQWQGIYVPLQVARQPFFLGNAADDKNQEQQQEQHPEYVLCINSEHPAVSENSAEQDDPLEALFDENQQPTPYLQQQQSLLEQLLFGEQITAHFIERLLQLALLTPLALDITFADNSSQKVTGLYAIDEEKLAKLDEQALFSLHQQQLLAPIYMIIASMGQIYALVDKKNKRIEAGQQWFQAPAQTSP